MSHNRYNTSMSSKLRQSDQRGMVSFLVTMIMMLVITLIVLGFSQVIRRNERETLDHQLSAQAFYAAESGVNVTKSTIASYIATNGAASLATKTACANGGTPSDYAPSASGGQGAAVSALGTGVQYTCVLVDPNPKSLEYTSVNTNTSVVAPINANVALKSLTFTWNKQTGDTGTSCSGTYSTFPANDQWACAFPVLRIDLVEDPTANISNLSAHTVTTYLTPYGTHTGGLYNAGSPGTVAFGTAATAYIGSGCNITDPSTPPPTCADSNPCNNTCSVTVYLPSASVTSYYARVTSIYRNPQKLTITGQTTTGTAALFNGAQAVVDVTGKSQDTLRRIQARVGLSGAAGSIPNYALGSSTGICKSFSIGSADTLTLSTLGPTATGTCN